MTPKWTVEYTDEFGEWWTTIDDAAQDDIDRCVSLLAEHGPTLGYPYSSDIRGSTFPLRELRVQSNGRPFRILYAFDPLRCALLLLGGDKSGDDDWYNRNIPIAERLYAQHLQELQQENQS